MVRFVFIILPLEFSLSTPFTVHLAGVFLQSEHLAGPLFWDGKQMHSRYGLRNIILLFENMECSVSYRYD